MTTITKTKKNDKVIIVQNLSLTSLLQVLRGNFKEGYKDIYIQRLDENKFKTIKWNREDAE